MKKIKKAARDRMKGFCRVCPQCDGVACAGEVPGMGGIGTGSSFKANLAALARWQLNIRVLHCVSDPCTHIDFLGHDLDLPVLAAPIGGVSFNMGGKITILADGGIRGGADVLKMIALGADAVMVGRPFSVAAMGGLKDGVIKYLQTIKSELISAMVLTGTPGVEDVDARILREP